MSYKVKDMKLKTEHITFSMTVNIENFDPNNIKIDEKSYKNILFDYIGYVTIKDSKYVKIYSVNPLHLIFRFVNGYFEEFYGNKYLTPVPTNESKEHIEKYEELWTEIRG